LDVFAAHVGVAISTLSLGHAASIVLTFEEMDLRATRRLV
jgi:hypothetical protein